MPYNGYEHYPIKNIRIQEPVAKKQMLINQTKEPRVNMLRRSQFSNVCYKNVSDDAVPTWLFSEDQFITRFHAYIIVLTSQEKNLTYPSAYGYDRPPSSSTGCRWTRSAYAYLNAPALSMDENGGSKHAITYIPQERCTMFFTSTPCQPNSTACAIFQAFMPGKCWDVGKSGKMDVIMCRLYFGSNKLHILLTIWCLIV